MSDVSIITIHVLSSGDLFQQVLNAIVAFIDGTGFTGLLKITALAGIFMVSVGYLKSRDPRDFLKWVIAFVLFINIVLIPKTTVEIDDISSQKQYLVDNVPVVFALGANLFTTIGVGLAESYDALLSMPDDLRYTKTGALFGSRLIQASKSFHIIDPQLKEEMDHYFRSCVVGDIRLNHKYSVGDLSANTAILQLITSKASPLRMTVVNGELVTCEEASKAEGNYSLRKKLEAEVTRAYSFFGINIFGKPENTTYEQLFQTHLTSAFGYYQNLTDSSSNIFLQSMMINALSDGINHYQTFTDATAGIVNQQFSKSQEQDRFSWEIGGIKALWFLPLLHTLLTILLFGIFPLVLALSTLPFGKRIVTGYLNFFFSLQLWPVFFAILNSCMTVYGSGKSSAYGGLTLANLDKIDELHSDISAVAGYLMAFLPFLAKGLVSGIGEAFGSLATSITGSVQSSAMSAAGEAASGSFSLGQTSFYNTNANNFSANKHDSNWTHMHGMHTEQGESGVLKTITGSGQTVFDATQAMSRSPIHINGSEALSGSLNKAYEHSRQAANNESQHYQTSLSNFSHRAVQLSEIDGRDLRLGSGVSSTETSQLTNAVNTMTSIAGDVAQRLGISTEDAMSELVSKGSGIAARGSFGVSASRTGASVEVEGHTKFDHNASYGNRANAGLDSAETLRQANDFNQAFSYVSGFAKNHHFDSTQSTGANLLNQMGADIRDAQTASHNYDASLSKMERIQNAKSYVESESRQINTNFDQAFEVYVGNRLGEKARDALFAHPESQNALNQLHHLGQEFISHKRDELVSRFGNRHDESKVNHLYHEGVKNERKHHQEIKDKYSEKSGILEEKGYDSGLGVDTIKMEEMRHNISNQIQSDRGEINNEALTLKKKEDHDFNAIEQDIDKNKMALEKKNILLRPIKNKE